MSAYSDKANRLNAAELAEFGDSIVYTPAGGQPFSAVVMLRKQPIAQSVPVGFFADVEIDPAVNPQKGDVVTWIDGVTYVVARVVAPKDELALVSLHRKVDPV